MLELNKVNNMKDIIDIIQLQKAIKDAKLYYKTSLKIRGSLIEIYNYVNDKTFFNYMLVIDNSNRVRIIEEKDLFDEVLNC